MVTPTEAEIRAGLRQVATIAEAIRELGSVPSGHLSLESYNKVIAMLVETKLVSQDHYMLTWIGGEGKR